MFFNSGVQTSRLSVLPIPRYLRGYLNITLGLHPHLSNWGGILNPKGDLCPLLSLADLFTSTLVGLDFSVSNVRARRKD